MKTGLSDQAKSLYTFISVHWPIGRCHRSFTIKHRVVVEGISADRETTSIQFFDAKQGGYLLPRIPVVAWETRCLTKMNPIVLPPLEEGAVPGIAGDCSLSAVDPTTTSPDSHNFVQKSLGP
jgi:hypothetical protein